MRRSIWKAILLASVLGMTMMFGTARADDTAKKKPVEVKPVEVKPAPGVVTEEASEVSEVTRLERRGLGLLRPREIKERHQARRESRVPLGCYGHFNDYSCNSFHSTMAFMFGSCRTFYGEACLKGPPPSPVPGFDPYALGVDGRKGRCPGCR